MAERNKLFAALLKYWRGRRGLSQLDLALTAGVSGRHISFLETGRSAPSVEMVMLLGGVLDVPLRDRNDLLRSAGFDAEFDEPGMDVLGDPAIDRAIGRMLEQQEPYPMLVMDGGYGLLRMNQSARRLLELIVNPVPEQFNAMRILFEPAVRKTVADWELVGRELVSRVQRESLHRPQDSRLTDLLDEILELPDVPDDWRRPDFSHTAAAVFPFRFKVSGMQLGFLTTVMKFNAPQNVTLDELQIESWFPIDDTTAAMCQMLASQGPG